MLKPAEEEIKVTVTTTGTTMPLAPPSPRAPPQAETGHEQHDCEFLGEPLTHQEEKGALQALDRACSQGAAELSVRNYRLRPTAFTAAVAAGECVREQGYL